MAADIAPFEVPAGRKVSLEVEAQVVGSRHLAGEASTHHPGRAQVRRTRDRPGAHHGLPRAAAYVVTGAFVILAFLLAMNFVRRRRAADDHSAQAEPR